MRTLRPVVAAALFVSLLAPPAFAQSKVDGAYEVKFEELATNCDPPRFAYTRGVVKIESWKAGVRVNIETIPQMAGAPGKSGKINAKTLKKSATTVTGLDGAYRVSGRVDENGVLQLVLVAEFTKTGETKTFCTQSWNVSGVRQTTATTPAPPTKKSAMDLFPALQ